MATQLKLSSVAGFNGSVPKGLILHPDGKSFVYPLGSTICIRDVGSKGSQRFLQGHTDRVTCLALSKCGRLLASGQQTYLGFKADIIIWDLEQGTKLHTLTLHKVKVQALDFSPDGRFILSLGGQDDGSLVLWDAETGHPICGTPTANNFTNAARFFSQDSLCIATGGNYNLTVWEYNIPGNKLVPHEVQLGQMRRIVTCLDIDQDDRYMYCGTTTGDVLQVSLSRRLLRNSGPAKGLLQAGVAALSLLPSGDVLAASGDGQLVVMACNATSPTMTSSPTLGSGTTGQTRDLKKLPIISSTKLAGNQATTIACCWPGPSGSTAASSPKAGNTGRGSPPLRRSMSLAPPLSLYVGTKEANVFQVEYNQQAQGMRSQLVLSAHAGPVHGLAFAQDYAELFATSALGEIRVWHTATGRELLRISVPNLHCRCLAFMPDGSSIISGWSDGKIRAFGPQSGKLLFTIHDAHHQGVTAIQGLGDSRHVVSGGGEGLVRLWAINPNSQTMVASMKEHKGAVNDVKVKASDSSECISASADGSCIIWDLTTFKRRTSLFANTVFKSAAYHPDESQIITAGTDRNITYFDAYDGQPIRIMEGSSDSIESVAVDPEGVCIASGGADRTIRLWGYDEGHCYAVGTGHSSEVAKVAITPRDSQHQPKVVSVGTDGSVMVWDFVAPVALESRRESLVPGVTFES